MLELLIASCLLISRIGTLSTFFMVGKFRSDTAHVGTSDCFMSTYFTHWYLSTFFMVRNFRSDTAHVGTSHCFISTYFTHWYLVYLLHDEKFSF